MTDQAPVVYLLHGENEFAISEFIARLSEKLGDKTIAEMNTTRLDGRSCSLVELAGAVSALPFLVSRRLVILTHPLEYGKPPEQQNRFKEILNNVPATTALILVEDHHLTQEKKKDKAEGRWLEKWAQEAGGRVYANAFSVPTGPGLIRWIQERTREAGGQIDPQAAGLLVELVGAEPRQLVQEIEKLLAYVNYRREITDNDVKLLTPSILGAPDFALVNSIIQHNAHLALNYLSKEYQEKAPEFILHSIVYQFRLLLMAREILDDGGTESDVVQQFPSIPFSKRLSPGLARLAARNAQRFSMPELCNIYHRLLSMDEALKTSMMEGELALDVLVTELCR